VKIKENLYTADSFEGDLSFEEIISQNQEKIVNLIYGMTGDYYLSQDLTQETFLKAFQSRHSFNGKSKFSTWLYRIAVRRWPQSNPILNFRRLIPYRTRTEPAKKMQRGILYSLP